MIIKDNENHKQQSRLKRLFKNDQFRSVIILVFVGVALPLAIYYSFRTFTTDVIALIVSGIPPSLRTIFIFIKDRRIDILSCIIVLSFVVSGALAAIQGDARIVLLQDSFVTAVIGLMFFLTLIPLSTRWFTIYPITHLVGRQLLATLPNKEWVDQNGHPQEMPIPDFMWQEMPIYRTFSYTLTAMWGFGLLAIFGARAAMIYTDVPLDKIVGIGTAVSATVNTVLGVISAISYFIFRRKYRQFDVKWMEENDFSRNEEDRVPNQPIPDNNDNNQLTA
ncbi:hypothetical protein BDA99DRAFT_543083 [Phascolomyces articulosus]|uniref:Uncharacterized protein n=1 Tax=Phascolomyces articulosus TaxID=60185 RepID=A0AAD5P8J8_9FUNG|nr:hypothetical protein BDA99DRAFT_543083 [Phascolomyces articulosus]